MAHPTDGLLNALQQRNTRLAVVGLGYVGLPLAVCLAKKFAVTGFDVDVAKVARLAGGEDSTGEVESAALKASGIAFTADAAQLKDAGFIIIAVPTPVDNAKRPDFSPLVGASTTVGRHLRRGAVVVFESTVYPGATEEVCVPVLEKISGLKAGRDFTYGYSPERINPGDRQHTIERVRKLVSGSDGHTLAVVAGVYGGAIPAGVYPTTSVRVAEAAKVIENTQRDLNIALVNELALIFHRLGIDTLEVLEAAGTKWNFLPFRPGLVGGHCIGVDPYYLTHKAQEAGYHAEVILAGRRINDGMGAWVAQECVRLMLSRGLAVKDAPVLVLGLTFKEDCADVRNTRVVDIVRELERFGAKPIVVDPVADAAHAEHEYGIHLVPGDPLPNANAAVVAVAHAAFKALDPAALAKALPAGAPVLDVKGVFAPEKLRALGLTAWRL
jgi:UDP-N-acetyl-D-galactosamine dehydrogenase